MYETAILRVIARALVVATIFAIGGGYLGAQPVSQARINLGPNINSATSELQPIISPDGQVLFFTRKGDPANLGFSTRPDDEDIWYSIRQDDGTWGAAIHLDGPLNTTHYDGVRAVNSTFTRLYLQNRYNPDGTRGKGFSVSERSADGSWMYHFTL
jgi:hypothetical protein